MNPKEIRCAIYTRKSSEDGLEQSFNSLQAQREACEAYIRSQAHEGWRLSPNEYDDGGYSGGSLERPALQKLLADIPVGQIDIIVVYKIDRLTRSLADFAKLVDVLDQHGVTFVSVTQQFNTTSSMGRLTLNVLLSFAQFEREITGERIRDKFAASKQKGIWMGGPVPLGYDVQDRKLVINPAEAESVRKIFHLYCELGSMSRLSAKLQEAGIRSKKKFLKTGEIRGGVYMRKGALRPLLRNRIYLGEMPHKGAVYPGLHEAIVPKDLWEKANALLVENTQRAKDDLYSRNPAPLRHKLFDDRGNAMLPKSSYRNGVLRYRAYFSRPVLKGWKDLIGEVRSIPANTIEQLVLARLATQPISEIDEQTQIEIFKKIERVELFKSRIIIRICTGSDGTSIEPIEIPIRLDRAGMEIIATSTDPDFQPVLPRIDKHLVRALVKAFAMRQKLESGEASSIADLTVQFGLKNSHTRRILPLGFLAPDLMEQILDGRQPHRLQLVHIADGKLPLDWEEQRTLFVNL